MIHDHRESAIDIITRALSVEDQARFSAGGKGLCIFRSGIDSKQGLYIPAGPTILVPVIPTAALLAESRGCPGRHVADPNVVPASLYVTALMGKDGETIGRLTVEDQRVLRACSRKVQHDQDLLDSLYN